MSKKSKKKNDDDLQQFRQECFDCLEALANCVHSVSPLTKAMLKEKAEKACRSCAFYHSINYKKKQN